MPEIQFHVPAGSDVRRCARCPQRIAFRITAKGRRQPINLPDDHPTTNERDAFDPALTHEVTAVGFYGISHHATCPEVAQFRRRK